MGLEAYLEVKGTKVYPEHFFQNGSKLAKKTKSVDNSYHTVPRLVNSLCPKAQPEDNAGHTIQGN